MRVIPEVTLSWLYTVLRFPARLGYPAGAVAELVVNAGHIGAPGPFEFLHHNDGKKGIHRLRALSSSWTTLTAASKPIALPERSCCQGTFDKEVRQRPGA